MPRLVLARLEENVSFYLWQALAPSTVGSYKSGQKRYLCFCQDARLQPLPLSERVLCLFVAQLAKENLTHQTIKCYLSAVCYFNIGAGYGDPFGPGIFPMLQYVLRGVKRVPRLPTCPRLPITLPILQCLKFQWSPHASDANFIMLWAACCVRFSGFMRAEEFTVKSANDCDPASSLTVQDVSLDQHTNPSIVCVHLKQSKTDPFRHGINIYLCRTKADLCPVAALLEYIAVRPDAPGPLFVYKDCSPLTRDKLVVAVRQALEQAGHTASKYSGHSFWIGAATTALQVGLEDSLIKMLGCWKSAAYQRLRPYPQGHSGSIISPFSGSDHVNQELLFVYISSE